MPGNSPGDRQPIPFEQVAAGTPLEPFEVTMSGSAELANAYVEGLPDGGKPFVVVTFQGTSGDAKGLSYAVPGFWDGGKVWKARFAAPAAGEWRYSAVSTDPAASNAPHGAPAKRPQTRRATGSCASPGTALARAGTSNMRMERRSCGSGIPGGRG